MYTSDYGYSADSKYWNTKLGLGTFDGMAGNSSWLQTTTNHKFHEWLLSPSSNITTYVACWLITYDIVNNCYVRNAGVEVRPCLYLKSNVKIISGDGSEQQPYLLEI